MPAKLVPKILRVGGGLAVIPFYDGRIDTCVDGRTVILIGPGKAFGSGEHETTASVLEEMEALGPLGGKRVLDLGCGTGILAIAAAKLGASEITAVDTEADALEATERNAALNGTAAAIKAVRGDVTAVRGLSFDLVLANLYGDLLLAAAGEIRPLLTPGGRLIVSGISYEYSTDVKRAFIKLGLEAERSRALENFCTLVFRG